MNKSLRKSFLYRMIIFVSIPLFVALFFTHIYYRANVQSILKRNDEIVELLKYQIDNLLENPKREIAMVRDVINTDILEEQKENNVQKIMSHFDYIDRIEIVNYEGIVQHTYPYYEDRVGFDISRTPIHSETLSSSEDYIYGDIVFDSKMDKNVVNIVFPAEENYIVGYMTMDTIQNSIMEMVDSSMMLTLVDNFGVYLLHFDTSQVQQRKVDETYYRIVDGTVSNRDIVTINTEKNYIHYMKISGLDWYLIAYQSTRAVSSSFLSNVIVMVSVIILLFLVLYLLMNITFNTVEKSVNQLRENAINIAKGNYDIHHRDVRYTEFSNIFKEFEVMAHMIEQRESEIGDLNQAIEDNYYHTIIALARAIEAKDYYTGNHSERVRDFSVAIGKELGLTMQEIRQLRYGSILHDIGKLGIDETLLNKRERLTEEEFDLIKEHTTMGYNIIKNIPQMKAASEITLYHHERFDGTGYPRRLSGYQIPVLARIVAIADAFDAMTSVRPYREKAMTERQALDELRDKAGAQFDPDFVKAFIRAIENLNSDIESIDFIDA